MVVILSASSCFAAMSVFQQLFALAVSDNGAVAMINASLFRYVFSECKGGIFPGVRKT